MNYVCIFRLIKGRVEQLVYRECKMIKNQYYSFPEANILFILFISDILTSSEQQVFRQK